MLEGGPIDDTADYRCDLALSRGPAIYSRSISCGSDGVQHSWKNDGKYRALSESQPQMQNQEYQASPMSIFQHPNTPALQYSSTPKQMAHV